MHPHAQEICADTARLISERIGGYLRSYGGDEFCPAATGARADGPVARIDLEDGSQLRITVDLLPPGDGAIEGSQWADASAAAVWREWNRLPAGHPAPVKHIARTLGMTPAEVAAVVYPAAKFGPWDDGQEPDLREREP